MRRFATEKFKSFLWAGTFSAFVGYVGRLSDSVIVGHVIGEDALAGLNMVAPLLAVVAFVASAVAAGTATNYSIWMGRLDRVRARGFFMQGLWTALALGALLSLLMLCGENAYFSLLDGSEYVEMYGRQYLDWAWPLGLTECLTMLLAMFCCVDGDIRLCAVALGGFVALNAGLSYGAVELGMGASGCALGTVVAQAFAALVLCGHFFRKVNTFAPVRRFSLADACRIFRASFGDSATFLCDGVLFFFLNKLVIAKFGSDALPVAGLAIVVWSFLRIFDGVGIAAQPLVTVYWGERNTRAIRGVVRLATVAAVAEAVLFGLPLSLCPQLAIGVLGVEYPDLVEASRTCVMLMCGGFLPLALTELFNSYFLFVERPWTSLGLTSACHLAMPAACAFAGSSFGLDGVWGGLAVGPWLGVLALALAILLRHGRRGFPLLLPHDRERKIHTFDLSLVEEEIVRTSGAVAAALPPGIAQRAALVVEEVFMAVRERNPNRRRLLGEVTLDLNDGVVMTLRDDGTIFDITDADAKVSSLRDYLVASVMQRQRERVNLVTSGFNRNVFRFA